MSVIAWSLLTLWIASAMDEDDVSASQKYGGKSFEAGSGKINFTAGLAYTWHDIDSKRNLIHVRPSTAVHPHKDVAVSLTGVAYWRQSTGDGIYALPGSLVRSP